MKIKPTEIRFASYDTDDVMVYSLDEVSDELECCDTYIAVVPHGRVRDWMRAYHDVIHNEDQFEEDEYTVMLRFDDVTPDGVFFMVCDGGGEITSGYFAMWCEKYNITSQFVVDCPDCTDVSAEEKYTGAGIDDPYLLGILHKVYN